MKITEYLSKEYGMEKNSSDSWKNITRLWSSWYKGNVSSFHNYSLYNGKNTVRMSRLSLQMAKKCCEDWADILFNERVKIELEDENSNDQLFTILEQLNFWEFMNQSVEQSGSVGTGAVVLSALDVENNAGGLALDYIAVENIYPISWENNRITECAFAVNKVIKGKSYVLLSVHHFADNGNMVIENKIFKLSENSNNFNSTELNPEDFGFVSFFDTGSTIPWFAIIKPAGVNNIDPSLPFGMPYFSQAIDVLKRIDNTFDSLQNEINLGRKRIFVREEMVATDISTGAQREVFDSNDISVYMLPKGFNADSLIQSENSTLRVEELTKDLENSLALFGDKCGFGVQYYQLDPTGQVREIGILTQNSKLIRRKKKHEIALESTVFDIISAILYAVGLSSEGLKITFDNDIINDENERKKIALMEVSSYVKSKAEYRMEFFGEDENIANKKISEINSESEVNYIEY